MDSLADLTALVNDLKRLGDKGVNAQLKAVNRQAAELVTSKARANASRHGKQMARAARTIKASSSATQAFVSMGTDSGDTWATAAMFGTKQGLSRSRNGRTYIGYEQFMPAIPGGYTVYPAIAASGAALRDLYAEGVDKILNKEL